MQYCPEYRRSPGSWQASLCSAAPSQGYPTILCAVSRRQRDRLRSHSPGGRSTPRWVGRILRDDSEGHHIFPSAPSMPGSGHGRFLQVGSNPGWHARPHGCQTHPPPLRGRDVGSGHVVSCPSAQTKNYRLHRSVNICICERRLS